MSELFEKKKKMFKAMSNKELLEVVEPSLGVLINNICPDGEENIGALIGLISYSLKLGFGTEKPNLIQKNFGEQVFGLLGFTMKEASVFWNSPISDMEYQAMAFGVESGFDVGFQIFNLLMCSAYADSGLKPEIESKIEAIFESLLEQEVQLEQMNLQLDELEEQLKRLCEEQGVPYPPLET